MQSTMPVDIAGRRRTRRPGRGRPPGNARACGIALTVVRRGDHRRLHAEPRRDDGRDRWLVTGKDVELCGALLNR